MTGTDALMGTLTSHLVTRDPDAASAWYCSVLGPVETSRITMPTRAGDDDRAALR